MSWLTAPKHRHPAQRPPEVSGPFEKFPEEVFREVVDVNLIGTFLMTQAAGARMVAA